MRHGKAVSGVFIVTCILLVALLFVPYRGHQRVSIGGREYSFEVVDTDMERMLGLGGRDSLCASCAMLFVFDHSARHSFWMKGMRFPLDIVWLSGDEVVFVKHRIAEDSQEVFSPDRDADRVLEFNAGEMDSVSIGDRAVFFR